MIGTKRNMKEFYTLKVDKAQTEKDFYKVFSFKNL